MKKTQKKKKIKINFSLPLLYEMLFKLLANTTLMISNRELGMRGSVAYAAEKGRQ